MGVVCVVALVLVPTGWGASLWGVFYDRERGQQAIVGAGAFAPPVYLVLLVFQAVIASLPAPAVAIVGGYTFRVVEGFALTWLGSLAGGVITFSISRLFGLGFVEGRGMTGRLYRCVEEHGVVLIFVLRLIPLVSFDAISYAAGLSGIRFRSFFAATALGMLPGMFAFVYFGGAQAGFGRWRSWWAWPASRSWPTSTRGATLGCAAGSVSGPGWKVAGCAHIMSTSWDSLETS